MKLRIATCICLFWMSCDTPKQEQDVRSKVVVDQPVKKEPPKKEIKYPYLTDKNAVSFLTQYGYEHPDTHILVETDFGNMEIELFKDTPLHRANFLYLIERGYYCPTEIIRVVKGFVIQGGNSDKELPAFTRSIIGKYTLPAEIIHTRVHYKGALAMSRSYQDNPDKRSSAYDFYFVDGKIPSRVEIEDVAINTDFFHTDEQISQYKKRGGDIHLDGEHTVFGRVITGFEVIDKIADLPTDDSDWPKETVWLNISVMKEQ